MNKGKYVFSQLLSFLDPFVFLRISKKYGGDKYVKTFSCWNQLAVMMFGQLSNRESLRDLVLATHAHANKAFHLGFGKHASKSTLADAVGYMDGQLTMSKYPEKIRRILYLDPESGRTFIFFSNALNINPLKVAELYHNRWQIELFFKWLKQHLKVKKFWGQTENAVRIQIYTAVTAYCMMAIVQKKMDVQRSIYEMLQLVSVSLTDTVELKTLFCKPNCNIVNEPDGSTEPTLF